MRSLEGSFLIQSKAQNFGDYWFKSYAVEKILDAKYNNMDINELMTDRKYLNANQQQQLT